MNEAAIRELPATDMETEEMLSLLRSIDERLSKVDEIEEEVEQIKKIVKGGDQPKTKLQVQNSTGSPGSPEVREIMKRARKGNLRNGVDTSEIQNYLEDEGIERSRQAILDLMKKIAEKFDNYKYRSGGGQKSSSLHYEGDGW